ncbi:MAG TPA: hypothetical protein PK788_11160 [Gemmatimonadaceae bacterium]|nr:hypothetical protein [Gemmatimonadaceae bacterium]HRQ78142.1 hypothetical protein [Gemmatimonadaceae bacterium]
MSHSPLFARRAYTAAAVYGILALAPQYFLEQQVNRDFPPAITHPEYFYGFVGLALVWQFAFLLIARDPLRYRPLMPITWLEKLSFGAAAAVLMAMGRIPTPVFALGLVDLALGALFVVAWLKTPRAAT